MSNDLIFFANTFGVFLFSSSVLLYIHFWEKNRELLLHTILAIVTSTVVTVLLKELFSTPRPFQNELITPEAGLAYLSSFPSLHTSLAFSTATTVALHKKKLGLFLLVISGLIGIGRVSANVHYPIDIAFGTLIGVTVSLFFETAHFKHKRHR